MKSVETTAAQGRAIALQVLRSADPDELRAILESGLPGGVFSALARKTAAPTTLKRRSFICGYSSGSTAGLSGLKPQIFLNDELPEVDAVSTVAVGLFEMARAIYLGAVAGSDPADLDVWITAGLPAEIKGVNPRFIAAYEDDRSMLKIDSSGASAALCSFAALRRLVLQDA